MITLTTKWSNLICINSNYYFIIILYFNIQSWIFGFLSRKSKRISYSFFNCLIITVKNFMSCHSSALTHCHKLIHFLVTVSGAFAPDFLLYSSDHFMVSHKSHHMLVYQPFLLLISIHQCFLTNPVYHSWYAC